jgi:hypothetical protein
MRCSKASRLFFIDGETINHKDLKDHSEKVIHTFLTYADFVLFVSFVVNEKRFCETARKNGVRKHVNSDSVVGPSKKTFGETFGAATQ